MSIPRLFRFVSLCLTAICLLGLIPSVRAQEITREQLQSLVPDETEMKGFNRTRPVGEKANQTQTEVVPDFVELNTELKSPRTGISSTITRVLYSTDNVFKLVIIVKVFNSSLTAQQELTRQRKGASIVFEPGSFSSQAGIGDECYHIPASPKGLVFREGNLIVDLTGRISSAAGEKRAGKIFSSEVMESVAQMVRRRAGQFSELTGIAPSPLQTSVK